MRITHSTYLVFIFSLVIITQKVEVKRFRDDVDGVEKLGEN